MKILVITPFTEQEWQWFGKDFEGHEWHFENLDLFGKKPWTWMFAALRKVFLARHFDIVISHTPPMTFYYSLLMRLFWIKSPHFAYGFNHGNGRFFKGLLKKLAIIGFRQVSNFVVFSEKEISIYSKYYDIPKSKFSFVHWGVNRPEVTGELPAYINDFKPYVSSIGRNNRDHQFLVNAVRDLPVRLIVVCAPGAVDLSTLPDNVIVKNNLSMNECMHILSNSTANIVPLKNESTGAGHMTLVSAMQYGIPSIVTRLDTVRDYFFDGKHGQYFTLNSMENLQATIMRMYAEGDAHRDQKMRCTQFADRWLSEESVKQFLADYLHSITSGGDLIKAPVGWIDFKRCENPCHCS